MGLWSWKSALEKAMPVDLKDYEPTMPAEALREMNRISNCNVTMQTKFGPRGWERRMYCDDCHKHISVEALIILCKDEDTAFQKILEFCAAHKHNSHMPMVRPSVDSIPTETGRRIKVE